jgi:hypothetical protein
LYKKINHSQRCVMQTLFVSSVIKYYKIVMWHWAFFLIEIAVQQQRERIQQMWGKSCETFFYGRIIILLRIFISLLLFATKLKSE